MIIYGSRIYGKKNKVQGWGRCEHCGVYGKNLSYTGRKWGHLYFIPLIPMGSKLQVMKECKKCSRGMHMPLPSAESAAVNLKEATEKALSALMAGQTTLVNPEGLTYSCADEIAESTELLICLGEGKHVDLLIAAMESKRIDYAHAMALAVKQEFEGNNDAATESYRRAATLAPAEQAPLVKEAKVWMSKGMPQNAEALLQKALKLSQNPLDIHALLLDVYQAQGEHRRVAETYAICFELNPALVQNKEGVKAYKKACKKAGLPAPALS